MIDKSKFSDIIVFALGVNEVGEIIEQEMVIVEAFEDGSYIQVSWTIVESVLNDPAQQTEKWLEYLSKWQEEGRI